MAAEIQDLIDALEDALDYEETGSLAKAKTVVTVTKKLLARKPSAMSGPDAASAQYDMNQLAKLKEEAQFYVKSNQSTGSVRLLEMKRR